MNKINIDKCTVFSDEQKALLKKQWGNDVLSYVLENDPRASIVFNYKNDYAFILSTECFLDVDDCYYDPTNAIYNIIVNNNYDFQKVADMFLIEPYNRPDKLLENLMEKEFDKIFEFCEEYDICQLLYTKELSAWLRIKI